MNDEDKIAYEQFKNSFSDEDFRQVSPEIFFEYGFLAGGKKELILRDAIEDILYSDSISSEINSICLEALDEARTVWKKEQS